MRAWTAALNVGSRLVNIDSRIRVGPSDEHLLVPRAHEIRIIETGGRLRKHWSG